MSYLRPMTISRKTSLAAGILYLLTFISIPTLSLYHEIHQPNFILGSAPSSDVVLGGMLELLMALFCIGTAIVLYPVLRKQNETLAFGFCGRARIRGCSDFCGSCGFVDRFANAHFRCGGFGNEPRAGHALRPSFFN